MLHPLPLTRMIAPKMLGREKGTCTICLQPTEHGFKIRQILSDKFADYDKFVHISNIVCEYCATFLKDERFRRKSWVITRGNVIFLSRQEVKKYLLEPPEPPFAVYISLTGKKHGWLNLLWKVNYSRDILHIGLEDVVVTCRLEELKEAIELVEQARKRKATKTEIEKLNVRLLQKVGREIYERLRETRERNEGIWKIALAVV